MSTKNVLITMTPDELRAVIEAAGNVMEADDAMEAVFLTESERTAAKSGYIKLILALLGQGCV
jgi:hypothetical protein